MGKGQALPVASALQTKQGQARKATGWCRWEGSCLSKGVGSSAWGGGAPREEAREAEAAFQPRHRMRFQHLVISTLQCWRRGLEKRHSLEAKDVHRGAGSIGLQLHAGQLFYCVVCDYPKWHFLSFKIISFCTVKRAYMIHLNISEDQSPANS